jgi:drug/metabolite transporter (DMT)-like permease
MGAPGLWVAVLSTASMACFITSVQYTTVANNSFIFGLGPFLIAGLAWAMIAERPSGVTLACATMAMMGVLLVAGSSLKLSGTQLLGDALALAMTITYAVKTVLVRQHRGRSMVAAGCIGALIGSAGALFFGPDLGISAREIGLFALFGFTQQGAGLILTTLGIARVPVAHAALIMSLDLLFAPLYVWLAFGEAPAALSLAGGFVVMIAVLAHILIEGRRVART